MNSMQDPADPITIYGPPVDEPTVLREDHEVAGVRISIMHSTAPSGQDLGVDVRFAWGDPNAPHEATTFDIAREDLPALLFAVRHAHDELNAPTDEEATR